MMLVMMLVMMLFLIFHEGVVKLMVGKFSVLTPVGCDEIMNLRLNVRHDAFDGLINREGTTAIRVVILEPVADFWSILGVTINMLKLCRVDVMCRVQVVTKVHQIVKLCNLRTVASGGAQRRLYTR